MNRRDSGFRFGCRVLGPLLGIACVVVLLAAIALAAFVGSMLFQRMVGLA
ncbi:hypothetical protein [Microbacterium arborescens]|nr:hypothetical protein [Microbacterium arborescens]